MNSQRPSSAATYYSEPHIQFLSQLLLEVARGELLIPRFQRPFVWRPQQQLDLLNSIRQGIPIGAIMVWRTANAQIACYDFLGPFALQKHSIVGTRDYLLDGVQRLSTLFGALNVPSPTSPNDSDSFDDEAASEPPERVVFDLQRLEFSFLKSDDAPQRTQLPLNILLDSVALLRYQRSLSSYSDADRMIAESDKLASAFRQYKIPIIPIATDDLGLATLTFQRVNSQGQKMSDYHMIHALTWSLSFDLIQLVHELRAQYLNPHGWDSLDEDPILKVIKLRLGLDVYKADIDELSTKIVSYPGVVESAFQALSKAAVFLRAKLEIPTPELVPYQLQIVLLADTLQNFPGVQDSHEELLSNWFWFVTYAEAFSSISDDKVRLAIDDLRESLRTSSPTWRNKHQFTKLKPLPRYDFRAARTKSFILNLARERKKVDADFDVTQLLEDFGRRAVQQLYPVNAFSTQDRADFGSLGNRVLCSPQELATLRSQQALHQKPSVALVGTAPLYELDAGPSEIVRAREQFFFKTEASFAESTAGAFWHLAKQ